MEIINRFGFTPITLFDYLCYLDGTVRLPRKPIIITFDDGYVDTYENAFPILDALGMKAVVFVLGNREINSNYWDQESGFEGAPLMTDEQMLELFQAGYEIGAHSSSHPRLPRLGKQAAWDEITKSRIGLEIILNSPVSSFSYPYGELNGEIKGMVADAGYRLACGVYTGPARFGEDLFEIRRLTIPGTLNIVGFASRLLLPHEYAEWIRWRMRSLMRRNKSSKEAGRESSSE
jgi:peptidoglycan/xylan/chitin deacetylase (PgdA/CDA1 family)